MYQRIKPWNPVGFRAKADFASGPAANHLKRLTQSGLVLEQRTIRKSGGPMCVKSYRD